MKYKIIFIWISFFIFNTAVFANNISFLEAEPGFKVFVFASDLDSPRQMAEGKNGTIFVAEKGGQILALIDSDKNGQVDLKIILAKKEILFL